MKKYGGSTEFRGKKHGSSASGTAVLHFPAGLLLLRCADRTCICACAALETCICVDDVLAVTLRDCADRTCVCTCTALDASITDYVCHGLLPPVIVMWWFVFRERSTALLPYCIIFSEKIKWFSKIFSRHPEFGRNAAVPTESASRIVQSVQISDCHPAVFPSHGGFSRSRLYR